MKLLRVHFTILLCLFLSDALAKQSAESGGWHGSQYQLHSRSQTVDARSLIQSLPSKNINTVIDLGCGSGNSMQVLRTQFPEAYILGVDPELGMLQKARQQFANDRHTAFLQGNAQTFRADKQADCLFAGHVMHWIPKTEQLKALENIRDNLKQNGRLALIMAPSKEGLPFQKALNKLIQQPVYAQKLEGFQQTQTFYKVDEYKELLEQTGFFVESIGYTYNKKRYENSNDLRLWIQQWLPYSKYLARKSTKLRDDFMTDLVQGFINESDQKNQTSLLWGEYVLSVIAHKK